MKKLLPLFIVCLTLSACDSPRSQRSVYGPGKSTLNNGYDLNGTTTSAGTGTTVTTPTTTPTNGSSSDIQIPDDAKNCKFSPDGVNGFESSSTHLDPYTFCQGTDKNNFYFQIKTPPVSTSGDVSVCFIPSTSSGSNSLYVGNPKCGNFTNPKAITKITFKKFDQYANAIINSVIFFKDTSFFYPVYNRNMMTLDAYRECMIRLAYPYYDSRYCQSFKNVGQYIIKNF